MNRLPLMFACDGSHEEPATKRIELNNSVLEADKVRSYTCRACDGGAGIFIVEPKPPEGSVVCQCAGCGYTWHKRNNLKSEGLIFCPNCRTYQGKVL